MGTFPSGHMLDPYTGRPLAAQVVKVLAYPTDLPVTPDDGPVVTGARGGYGRFTVADEDAVTLVASDGTAVDLVSVEAQTRSGAPVTLGAPVPTAADLPVSGERPGAARITQDTLHLWQWDGSAWVDLGSIQGPPGDGSGATWDTLSGKPPFIAAGSSQATARSAIGAGTSNLTLGTTTSTAARGNHTHDDRYYTETEADDRFTRHVVLDEGDPVPPGTPEGTLILRRTGTTALGTKG